MHKIVIFSPLWTVKSDCERVADRLRGVFGKGLDVNLEYGDLENGNLESHHTHPNEIRESSWLIRDTRFWESRKPYSRLMTFTLKKWKKTSNSMVPIKIVQNEIFVYEKVKNANVEKHKDKNDSNENAKWQCKTKILILVGKNWDDEDKSWKLLSQFWKS